MNPPMLVYCPSAKYLKLNIKLLMFAEKNGFTNIG